MTVITRDPHLWVDIIDTKTGKKLSILNDERYKHNLYIAFEVNFSDAATPPVNTITFYNLSDKHRNFLKKKFKVILSFNWGAEKKTLSEGFITKVDMEAHDGVNDSQQITFTEGTNYSNVEARKMKVTTSKKVSRYKNVKKKEPGHYEKKRERYSTVETYKCGPKKGQTHTVHHFREKQVWVPAKEVNDRVKTRATVTRRVNRVFKKGTSYRKLIEGIASQAGIKIDKIQLAKNPTLKKSFTAKGKPLNLLKQVVKKTESVITYSRGHFLIVDPKSDKRTWVEIDDQDLIQPPSFNESDDDSDKGTWEITIPLVPEIVANVGILMKSKYLKGKFYVKAGQHTSDGENPQTQCSLAKI